MASAKATTDHDVIRKWVEKHGGRPAHVSSVAKKGEIGILRIDFPQPPDNDESADANLEEISWDEFFEKFEAEKLAFLYQEDSNFNKLVSRENVEGGGSKKR
jgi:hypothetical protein